MEMERQPSKSRCQYKRNAGQDGRRQRRKDTRNESRSRTPEGRNEAQMASLVSRIEDNNEKFTVLQGTLLSQMDRHQEKMDAWIADMK
jgi:hypothetical protein